MSFRLVNFRFVKLPITTNNKCVVVVSIDSRTVGSKCYRINIVVRTNSAIALSLLTTMILTEHWLSTVQH